MSFGGCMSRTAHMRRIRTLAIAILPAAGALNACFSARLATGERGVDTSSLRVGATRVEAEALLGGRRVGELRSAGGVRFVLYAYNAGRPAHPLRGSLQLPLAIYNEVLGLPFALISGDPCVVYGPKFRPLCEAELRERTYQAMAVGYDEAEKIREVVPEEDLVRRFPEQAEELRRTLEHVRETFMVHPGHRVLYRETVVDGVLNPQ
jgi:hypothetical protein